MQVLDLLEKVGGTSAAGVGLIFVIQSLQIQIFML